MDTTALLVRMNAIQVLLARAGDTSHRDDVQLPTIVVVGSQSSGKSSILEAIVGGEFLPRGTGTVTRQPIILQLQPRANTTKGGLEVEFGHLPGRVFTHMGQVQEHIVQKMTQDTQHTGGFSDSPIVVRLFSPGLIPLTLVDLPGLTAISTHEQDQGASHRIRQMVLAHCRPMNVIILAVSSANVDLANSEALALARVVDPKGERTLGVMTKVDLMDRGTDCSDVLNGKTLKLRHDKG